tara:strand:+ start:193 stop:498 length:306 start_codon:yes stop_codon:yes gene_type:complete
MINAIREDSAIQPMNQLMNRWQWRRYEKEAIRVVGPLEEINSTFLYELFSEKFNQSYSELYEEYSIKWIDRVKAICKSQKVRHIGIDLHWFERNYKPRHND